MVWCVDGSEGMATDRVQEGGSEVLELIPKRRRVQTESVSGIDGCLSDGDSDGGGSDVNINAVAVVVATHSPVCQTERPPPAHTRVPRVYRRRRHLGVCRSESEG